MTLSDIELCESLLARDETDRRLRFHGGILLLVAGMLSVSRYVFGRSDGDAEEGPKRGLIEEPVVMITLAGWGLGILLQFLDSHKKIDRRIGK
jgi:hypothetical protein